MGARRSRTPSAQTVAVLRALADGATYGFDVMDATRLPSGTVYPILSRAERAGLVEASWEAPEEHRSLGRPARKYYRLTTRGREVLDEALERMRTLTRPLPGRA